MSELIESHVPAPLITAIAVVIVPYVLPFLFVSGFII
jgi:hypothetical protein